MRVLQSKYNNGQMVSYNGTYYTIISKVYDSDLNEWQYYLTNLTGPIQDPISEDKIQSI